MLRSVMSINGTLPDTAILVARTSDLKREEQKFWIELNFFPSTRRWRLRLQPQAVHFLRQLRRVGCDYWRLLLPAEMKRSNSGKWKWLNLIKHCPVVNDVVPL